MAKYLDSNGLLYLWQKIVNKFVVKETGKGLSTNDFTTELKNKLDGIDANANKYTLPTASAETLGGVKVGAGLEINESGVLNAIGGGAADSVEWSNVQNKPESYPPSEHNHDSAYLKLSGGTMTGPIQFSADQGQIKVDATAAEAKLEMDSSAAEIIFTDKTGGKTNRMTVSATGAVIAVGETTPGDGTGTQITIDGTNGVKIPNVANPVNDRDAANKTYVDTKVSTKAETSSVYAKNETYAKTEVYNRTEIDSKLSAVYKPGGSVLFSELPEPSATTLGFVYNLKEAFITDDRFIASTPVPYPIGTDVAVVAVPGDPITYKYDVMAGFVDLSGYLKTADVVAISNGEIDTVVASQKEG